MSLTVPDDSYCTMTNLEGWLAHRTFNTTSRPTLAEAEQAIKDVADEMNAQLSSLGYTPCPVTNTTGIKVLKTINAKGAAAAILQASYSADGQGSPLGSQLRDEYDAALKKLWDGKLRLGSAGESSTAKVRPTAHSVSGQFSVDASGDERDPVFERDHDW